MSVIAARSISVDLDVLLIVISICVILAVGILLVILLIRLNKTVAKINSIISDKKADIEKTIENLPGLTENISDVAQEAKAVVSSVNNVTNKVESSVKAVSLNGMIGKIPVIIESCKKAFEFVSQAMAARRKNSSEDDVDEEVETFEEELAEIDR